MWWGRLVLMGATAAATVSASAQSSSQETVVVHGSCCSSDDAEGGRRLSFDCLNAELKESSAEKAPDFKAVDAAGRGNPEKLGTFSYTATQIRMGKNFGKSIYPERPPAPSLTNAFFHGGK